MLTTIALVLVCIVCGYLILTELYGYLGLLFGYLAGKAMNSQMVQGARQRAAQAIRPEDNGVNGKPRDDKQYPVGQHPEL
jgi:hypothetical protein